MFKNLQYQKYYYKITKFGEQKLYSIIALITTTILLGILIYAYRNIPYYLEENYNVQKDLYENVWYKDYYLYLIVASICFIIIQIIGLFINYEATVKYEMLLSDKINKKILPGVIYAAKYNPDPNSDLTLTYSLDKVLEAYHLQDFVIQASLDPRQFWLDYADLIKMYIFVNLKTILLKFEIKYINGLISNRIQEKVKKLIDKYGNDRFIQFINDSSKIINNHLQSLTFDSINNTDEKYNDYRIIIDQLGNFFSHAREIMHNNHKVAVLPKLQMFPDFNILDVDPTLDSHYNKSFSASVAKILKESGEYNVDIDYVLNKWYHTRLSNNYNPIKLRPDHYQQNFSTSKLINELENKMNIFKIDFNQNAYTCMINSNNESQHRFETSVNPDKRPEDIYNIIKGNSAQLTDSVIPYYHNLVTDFKQVKLVFDEEQGLLIYLEAIKQHLFGENYDQEFYISSSNVYVRLREILNGFADEYSEAQDVRIMLEVYYKEVDWTVSLELLCYIKSLERRKDIELILQTWEDTFQAYSAHSRDMQELKKQQGLASLLLWAWRVLLACTLVVIMTVCLATWNHLQQYVIFDIRQCTAEGKVPYYILDECVAQHSRMDSTQFYNFCTEQVEDTEVRKMCAQYPAVYYNHCMLLKQTNDFFNRDFCGTHWVANSNKFNYSLQFDFCVRYQHVPVVYASCGQIPGIYYDHCLTQPRQNLSSNCELYWETYHDYYNVNEQIQFCNRFQDNTSVTLICENLNEIFKEVCIVQPLDNMSVDCQNWYANSYNSLSETDNYLFCYYFKDTYEVINTACTQIPHIYYNLCYMQDYEQIQNSQNCLSFFVENYLYLTDDQQLYYCQFYGNLPEIINLCYSFDHMNNFLYDICMTIPASNENYKCVTYLQDNYLALDIEDLKNYCLKHKSQKEITIKCNEVLGEPVKFVKNYEMDNICAYTTTNFTCADQTEIYTENYAQLVELVDPESDYQKLHNISFSENSSNIVLIDRLLYGSVDEMVYGEEMADYSEPIIEVQSTNNVIVYQNTKYQIYSNVPYTMDFPFKLSEYIFMGYRHTCILDAVKFSCTNTYIWYDNYVPEGWEYGIKAASLGPYHTCVIRWQDLESKCWGRDFSGAVDIPEHLVYGLIELETVYNMSCGLDEDRYLHCWGYDFYITIPEELEEVAILDFSGYNNYLCAIREEDLEMTCVGYNTDGAMDPPADWANRAVQVEAGYRLTCALDVERLVGCWGLNANWAVREEFVGQPLISVTTGYYYTCMVRQVDFFYTCTDIYNSTTRFAGSKAYFDLVAGYRTICGSLPNGSSECWGYNPTYNIIDREISYLPTGDGESAKVLPMNGHIAHTFSLSIARFLCFSFVEDFYCTVDGHKTKMDLDLYKNQYCTTSMYVCYILDSDHTKFECADPSDPTMKYYQIDQEKMIEEVGCNTDRVCVRFADQTIYCLGGINMYNENNIPFQFTECISMHVGLKTTCCLKEDLKYYCNGVRVQDQGVPAMYDGLTIPYPYPVEEE